MSWQHWLAVGLISGPPLRCTSPNSRRRPKCTECDQPWPCRTSRILRGDQ